MLNKLLALLLTSLALASCNNKSDARNKPDLKSQFTSLEMSYTDGWRSSFSIFIDSSKIFLASKEFDSLHYGIVPDSLYSLFVSLAKEIKSTSFKSHTVDCQDCLMFSLRMITANDTFNIIQTKTIDSPFIKVSTPIVQMLQSHNRKIKSHSSFPTQSFGVPPPIPAPENKGEMLFIPPKH